MVTYKSREEYFNKEKYVFGGETDDLTLEPGEHSYPFSFVLPDGLPTSVVRSLGKIT